MLYYVVQIKPNGKFRSFFAFEQDLATELARRLGRRDDGVRYEIASEAEAVGLPTWRLV